MDAGTILTARQLSTGYSSGRKTTVHENLNFSLTRGTLTSMLGYNGAGKSTLLRTMAGMQPPLSGSIDLLGRPLSAYTAHERSKVIGMILTDRMQAGGLTVFELVALGRQPYTGFFGRLTQEDKAKVRNAIDEVGMTAKARAYVAELSDGERQKAMIAKTLVQECPLVLLDEPTAFLDVENRIEVMRLLRRVAVDEGKAVLLSTHDVDQALAMSDRLWLMTRDRQMVCGMTEDLVLSGIMDNLFDSASIRFDMERGLYTPENTSKRYVRLEAANESLRYWAQNVLVRHGWQVADEDGDAPPYSLKVDSAERIIWTCGAQSAQVDSFSRLVELW